MKEKILISEEEIQEKIVQTAKKIDEIYDGKPILLLGILKGSFMFMSDLCKRITVPCEVDFMRASSYYNGTVSTGTVNISLDTKQDLSGYNTVLCEDIVDTGRTLKAVTEILKQRNPATFTVITLLDKPERRVVDFTPDISLFTVPDLFVVGYGLDCGELDRNKPYIAVKTDE